MIASDPLMKETFPSPPIVAYKRPPTIKDKLIHSKVPETRINRPKRQLNGVKKCLKCVNCSYVRESKVFKAVATKDIVTINAPVSCQTSNVVYCISCLKCRTQYIGKTDHTVGVRMGEHRGTINNVKIDKSVAEHFNSRGHNISDFSFSVVEKVFNKDPMYLKIREDQWIIRFNTKHKGLIKNG